MGLSYSTPVPSEASSTSPEVSVTYLKTIQETLNDPKNQEAISTEQRDQANILITSTLDWLTAKDDKGVPAVRTEKELADCKQSVEGLLTPLIDKITAYQKAPPVVLIDPEPVILDDQEPVLVTTPMATEEPVPKVDEPAPKVNEPVPKVDEPAPKVNEPLPKVNELVLKVDEPKKDCANCSNCGKPKADMTPYQVLFKRVGGVIHIDPNYPVSHYEKILDETKIESADLINACGGLLAISGYPVLDLKGQMGSTEYIDFLKSGDLSSSIMRGLDKFGRPFIAFRYVVRSGTSCAVEVETMFQRYRNDPKIWTTGGKCSNQISMYQPRIADSDKDGSAYRAITERLQRLLKHQPVGLMAEKSYKWVESAERLAKNGKSAVELV